jgi:hypothetical protein
MGNTLVPLLYLCFVSLSLQVALWRAFFEVITAVTSQRHVSGTSRRDVRRTVTDFYKRSHDKAFLDTLVLTTKILRFIETSVTIFQSIELNIPEYGIFKNSIFKRGGESLEIILPKITYFFLMRTEMYD